MKLFLFRPVLYVFAFTCLYALPLKAQTFFGVSASPADNGNLTAATVTITPPAAMVAGDLVIIYAEFRNNGNNLTITTTGGQAWTTEAQYNNSNQRTRIFWCRFNGTWGANPVITRAGATAEALSAIMYVFRPTVPNSTWVIENGPNNNNTTNATVPITGLTTTVTNTVTMAFWGCEDDVTWGTLTGTNWVKATPPNQYRNIGGSTGQSHTEAYNIQALPATLANVQQIRVPAGSINTNTSIICWQEVIPTPATIDYGKSYSNITKNNGGGTISPGDTLEIRATLAVRSLAVDSLSFIDTLGKGLNFVTGSIAVRTNEGKVYRWDNQPKLPFTNAQDNDGGYIYTSAGDSIIRINIGVGSTGSARGKLRSNSTPVAGNSSVIMATYRVVVDTTYNSIIDLGGGNFTLRDSAQGIIKTLPFADRSAVVYQSPGLCPNLLSANNAVSDEFGGTFGNAVLSATLRPMKNRTSSLNVLGYTYTRFSTNTPDDYFYGITNNSGAGIGTGYTAINTWAKPDNAGTTHRVHRYWDISGDHTGATNQALGNPACDTTLPVSASNPCGYMLVLNSAYKTDTAFQYNINNLCPSTYYEISFWVKNMCSKCGADSLGRMHSNALSIPLEPGDSSGVRPNLAIDINGIDYYTTGQIRYTGTTLAVPVQDANNIWVKRGFTYLTGPTPGVLVMSIRNTAPGGGGNDWALDDIAVATCLPNMVYSPSANPTVCVQNASNISDTVRSFFNNYVYYKWQRSTNGGATYIDVSLVLGPAVPTFNATLGVWQYVTNYNVPPIWATLANNGDLYRVVAATTPGNLGTANCVVTNGINFVTLNVLNCGIPLKTDLLSFNGKLVIDKASLSWVTSNEEEAVKYFIERSSDGSNFTRVGTLDGSGNLNSTSNQYSFIDPTPVSGKVYYRILIASSTNNKKYSRTVELSLLGNNKFTLSNVINPFYQVLGFNITSPTDTKIDAELLDMFGKVVKRKTYLIHSGVSTLNIPETESLSTGTYILRVTNNDQILSTKVLKKNL